MKLFAARILSILIWLATYSTQVQANNTFCLVRPHAPKAFVVVQALTEKSWQTKPYILIHNAVAMPNCTGDCAIKNHDIVTIDAKPSLMRKSGGVTPDSNIALAAGPDNKYLYGSSKDGERDIFVYDVGTRLCNTSGIVYPPGSDGKQKMCRFFLIEHFLKSDATQDENRPDYASAKWVAPDSAACLHKLENSDGDGHEPP
jgi:hypothetical protein